uniref:C. briggsae CBR-CLC-1 protein n=1 Tax=Haemonchus contortus TaxID=6289 RepID=A0A7I4YBC9_HAECO|nr:Protein CLC-1 [Haemonchus contortus]
MCVFSACGQIVFGVVMIGCVVLTAIPTFNGKFFSWDCLSDWKKCDPFEQEEQGYMKTVAIFMVLALGFEIIALIWNLIAFCACCCKQFILHPLTILSFLVTCFLLVAVIVYAVNNKDNLGHTLHHKDQYGYSFWLSVCALVLAAADTVIAGVTVCLGGCCL